MINTTSNKEFITFYGEYNLQHWLELILNNEITLPNFQRYFVWDPKRTIRLMESFNRGLFVPPVLIANFTGDDKEEATNYILDGQQRLSAVLLTFLGVFPNRFKTVEIDSDIETEGNQYKKKMIIDWDFRKIQEIFKNKCCKDIKELGYELRKANLYCPIDLNLKKIYNDTNSEDINLYNNLNIDENFLKTRFLGYSYIKAIKPNPKSERLLFGTIFKNINTSSVKLRPDESRSALYWISGDKSEFFKPDFMNEVKVVSDKIDFARYMALLANTYNLVKEHNCDAKEIMNVIAIGYARGRRFEDYITEYVETVSNDNNSNIFGKFSEVFPSFKDDLDKLREYFEKNIIPKNYKSYMTADFYLFGLFYWILFKKKNLILDETLKRKLLKAENDLKKAYNNKNLNRLGAIRNRIISSISIYSEYLEGNCDN